MKPKILPLVLGALALAMGVVTVILANLGEITVVELSTFLGIGLLVVAIVILLQAQKKSD